MDFKKATSELMAGMTREEIAKGLGCSVASLRQARLGDDNAAHREPPQGWEARASAMAEREANRLQRVAKALQRQAAK